MLQNIHDKAKGWIAYAIVIFISIPFALFGINSYLGGSDALVAAVVNGEEIPAQQVQNAVLQQRQQLTQMFGGKIPPGFSNEALKIQALEQSVNQVLLSQLARENGYRASNQEVYDFIAEIPAFQKDGQFDVNAYDLMLSAQRRSKVEFETQIRESISNQQFSEAIVDGSFVTPDQVARLKKLQEQKRTLSTLSLSLADNKAGIEHGAEEVKSYYEARPDAFMTDEKVKLRYLYLKESDLADKVEMDEDRLRLFYDENPGQYRSPEKRKVAHILVRIDTDKHGADAHKKAEQKAGELHALITQGEKTFEEIASTESDDTLAREKNGELGVIERGDMGAKFEAVAFALKTDEISEPVLTEAGYEIVRVSEITESKQKTYEEVKQQVETAFRKVEAEKLFLEATDKMQTLAFENDSSLDAAAEAAGLKIERSEWITRDPAKNTSKGVIETSPKIIEAAFSDDVLNQGKNSELLELKKGQVALVRLFEHQKSVRKPLDQVETEIRVALTEQKARKKTLEQGEMLLADLKKSGWSVLESHSIAADKIIKTADLVRTDTRLPREVVDEAFSMTRPANDQVLFGNTVKPNGDYVLIGLEAVSEVKSEPSQADFDKISGNISSREKAAVLKAVRERAEVILHPENIE